LTRTPARIVFAGTPDFAVPALDALHEAGHRVVAVYTQPDRPAGRGRSLTASPVKQRATVLGMPVLQPVDLKQPDSVAQLASHQPDVMVVVAYGLILPQAILDVPRLGCLNIHASLLPRWRGAAPIQRAIIAGDARTGVTIMRMEAGLDTGPTLLVRALEIDRHETGGSLHDRLAATGAQAILSALEGWLSGELPAVPQPAEGITYAAKISKEEALIDWSLSAQDIERRVRAFNPWPVCETRLHGAQLRVWEAVAEAAEATGTAMPGTVLSARDDGIRVQTGAGVLRLDRLQLPGRKPLGVRDFLNSQSLEGERLGEHRG